jgi:hypothetical protein
LMTPRNCCLRRDVSLFDRDRRLRDALQTIQPTATVEASSARSSPGQSVRFTSARSRAVRPGGLRPQDAGPNGVRAPAATHSTLLPWWSPRGRHLEDCVHYMKGVICI